MRIIQFLSFLAVAAAQGCSSVSGISHTSAGCAAGEGNPDCAFIQANSAAICAAILPSWEIVNGPAGACNLRGTSYGCIYAAGAFSTTDTFCCALGPPVSAASPSASASASASVTASGSPSVTASGSPSVSTTPSTSVSASATTSPSTSATVSPSPSATPKPSASSSYSAVATATAAPSTNTTIIIKTIFVNSSDPVLSIGASVGIGISGTIVTLFCCLLGFYRKRPFDKELFMIQIPIEPKIVQEVASRRPSMIIRTAV
jgi:hypothetical protein